MNSHEVFIHIHQGCFAGTGAIVRLPQCQWSRPDGYGKISQCITTTKHSKAKTVCIFLGIYCICHAIENVILNNHQWENAGNIHIKVSMVFLMYECINGKDKDTTKWYICHASQFTIAPRIITDEECGQYPYLGWDDIFLYINASVAVSQNSIIITIQMCSQEHIHQNVDSNSAWTNRTADWGEHWFYIMPPPHWYIYVAAHWSTELYYCSLDTW